MNIGIIGRRRSGKDTLANYLMREHGYARVGFADAVKEAALALNPWIDVQGRERTGELDGTVVRLSELVESIGWEDAKDFYPEVRRILQRLGDEAGRQVHGDNTWVNTALRKIGTLSTPVVVPDVRYPNEVSALRHAGFRIVRITRGNVTRGSIADGHASESNADVMEADMELTNDGTLHDLHDRARSVIAL
jgi:hypothetical protein